MQTKTATYILILVFILCETMRLCGAVPVQDIALYAGTPIWHRFSYLFFHANIFHCTLNAWVLIQLVRTYRTPLWELATAFLIAFSLPAFCLNGQIVGASGAIFALAGITTYRVLRKRFYLACMLSAVLFGFLIPGVAGLVHLYCFTVGLLVALLNWPI